MAGIWECLPPLQPPQFEEVRQKRRAGRAGISGRWSAAQSHSVASGKQPGFAATPDNATGQESPSTLPESNTSESMRKTPTREQVPSSTDESSALTSETLGGNLPHPEKRGLHWKAANEPNTASTTSTPNALADGAETPSLSGQNNPSVIYNRGRRAKARWTCPEPMMRLGKHLKIKCRLQSTSRQFATRRGGNYR